MRQKMLPASVPLAPRERLLQCLRSFSLFLMTFSISLKFINRPRERGKLTQHISIVSGISDRGIWAWPKWLFRRAATSSFGVTISQIFGMGMLNTDAATFLRVLLSRGETESVHTLLILETSLPITWFGRTAFLTFLSTPRSTPSPSMSRRTGSGTS